MSNNYYNSGFLFDDAALNEIADERVLEHYDDIHNSDIRGKERFNCRVMSKGPEADQQATGRYYMCYVRPMDTMHDHCTPDPCENTNFSANETKLLISMQMLVSTEYPIGTQNRAPYFLESGEVSFYGEGPNASSSKMRVAKFQSTAKQSNYGSECAGKQIPGSRGAFGGAGSRPLGNKPSQPTANLGKGWKPGSTLVSSFGQKVPCSSLVNFGRTTPVDFFAYGKNPPPSQATDDLFWKMVIEKLGAVSTPKKIRFFNAWAAKEGSSMSATNNPFATSHPGGGKPWSKDPNMTAYNWSKPTKKRPEGAAWVKNYSTMEAGATATASTIKSKGGTRYSAILAKILEPNADFPDSWFDSKIVDKQFEKWGGEGADGVDYAKGVKKLYKKGARRRKPINTNTPGGRSAKCVDR